MADLAFKEKITKKKFETKLIEDFGRDNLIASPYNEMHMDENDEPYHKCMTLYYIETDNDTLSDQHVGTWMYGEGWIFEKAYQK